MKKDGTRLSIRVTLDTGHVLEVVWAPETVGMAAEYWRLQHKKGLITLREFVELMGRTVRLTKQALEQGVND